LEVSVTKINEVYMRVDCEASIAYELNDYFSFFAPGYKFNPKFKAGFWNGKIQIYKLGSRLLYVGLLSKLQKFCTDRGYNLSIPPGFVDTDISFKEVLSFLDNLKLSKKPREYQIKSFVKCIRKNRLTLLSPTASGKSLIIYLLCRWYDIKTLIIVPNTTLLAQMADDFSEYGYEEEIHQIKAGVDKNSDCQIVISTWQSLVTSKLDRDYYQQYELVICDEVHGSKAQEMTKIMESFTSCKYRFGTTGTLDDTKVNPTIIQGLFGDIYKSISTDELIKQGHIAEIKIKCLVLKYPVEECKSLKSSTYQEEIDFLCAHDRRNNFIYKLVESLEGNTLILFNYVEKHGRVLEELFRTKSIKPIYWISGSTDSDERNEIRKIVNTENNAVLLGSKGTTSTGINVPNIHNIVFASPGKAKIQTLQSIGRGLRKSETKDKMTLFDVADDLQYKKKENYTLDHFRERCRVYDNEKFQYKIYSIGI